jgi:hypothetical protein
MLLLLARSGAVYQQEAAVVRTQKEFGVVGRE